MKKYVLMLIIACGQWTVSHADTLKWSCTATGYGLPGSTEIPPFCSGYSCLGDEYKRASADAVITFDSSIEIAGYFEAEDASKALALKNCWAKTGHCILQSCTAPNNETIRFGN